MSIDFFHLSQEYLNNPEDLKVNDLGIMCADSEDDFELMQSLEKFNLSLEKEFTDEYTARNVNSVFEKHCQHLVFNQEFAKKISKYKIAFEHKNTDHITFFGGNLTGVHPVRFLPQDKEEWFVDILGINELEVEEEIYNLPGINKDFNVSSDLFNLSCVWLIHKFMLSPYLNDQQKYVASLDTVLCMQYKLLTSLLFRYFKYPAHPEEAAAAYAALNNKFLLKQKGNWRDALASRGDSVINTGSIHYKTLKTFNNDYAIVYMLNDIQGRIRDMLKNIYEVLMQVHRQGVRISSTTTLSLDQEGTQVIKDKVNGLTTYNIYMQSIITDKNSFFKQDIYNVICGMMHTMDARHLKTAIEWCSDNYTYVKKNEIERLVELTLIHSFNYLQNNRSIISETNDLKSLLTKLKNIYMSSKSIEPDLLKIRDLAEWVVNQSVKTKNSSLVASTRTGLLLYICLRAYTMHKYS